MKRKVELSVSTKDGVAEYRDVVEIHGVDLADISSQAQRLIAEYAEEKIRTYYQLASDSAEVTRSV